MILKLDPGDLYQVTRADNVFNRFSGLFTFVRLANCVALHPSRDSLFRDRQTGSCGDK